MTTFADLMMSLDRCEHGRHLIDDCLSCVGENPGNELIVPGTQIGWTVRGDRIVVPYPMKRSAHKFGSGTWNDPNSWVQPR